MASRLQIAHRVQRSSHLSRPHSSSPYSRSFTLSARLAAKRRAARPPPGISVRTQKPAPQPAQHPLRPAPIPPSSSRSRPSEKPQTLDVLIPQRKWPLFGAGIVALGIGLYTSLVITSTLQDKDNSQPSPSPSALPITITTTSNNPPSHHHQPPPTGLPATLDPTTPTTAATTALAFDKSLNLPEWLMGIAALRRDLSARARGHVLEIAVGTGRNLAHYDWSEVVSLSQSRDGDGDGSGDEARAGRMLDRRRRLGGAPTMRDGSEGREGEVGSVEGEVLSFTGVDVSGEMLGVARDRIREAVPGLRRIMRKRRAEEMPRLLPGVEGTGEEGLPVVDALEGRVRLVLGDAVGGLPPPPSFPEGTAPAKYDTIIQTFGLCSVADPGRLLANMAAKVQPDTGRILLLEHGRGVWDWMNNRLDKSAPKHFQKFGCWWNRDIEKLVREAAQTVPGLEVVKLERPLWFQWGTTMLIELKVKGQPNGGHAGKKA